MEIELIFLATGLAPFISIVCVITWGKYELAGEPETFKFCLSLAIAR